MYHKQGFTFVEVVITIVILGIALSALTWSLSTSVIQGAAPIAEEKARTLAQAYLDEILPLKFDDSSPEGGGSIPLSQSPCTISNEGQSRAGFDDVDDYHGIINSPPVLSQTDFDISQYINFSVSIQVSCQGLSAGLSANHLAKLITITVITSNNEQRSISVFRGNF